MNKRKKRTWTEAEIKLNEQSTTLTAQLHGIFCPKCGSNRYAKNGKQMGNQRYRCGRCGKHFRNTTGNTIHHLHLKPKIQGYIECMNQGLSLRKTADKLDISLQTAFRWRHRFLSAMQKQPERKPVGNKTISAFTLPFSTKGKPEPEKTMPAVTSILQLDITGQTVINIVGKHGIPVVKIAEKFQKSATYIKNLAIPRLCKIENKKCRSNKQIILTEEVHLQIHRWLGTFRGVATKYLENYWNWFTLNRQMQLQISQHSLYMHNCF